MTIVLLAHTGVQNVKNPVDGDYTKFCPDLDRKVWARVAAWLDIILRADYEYSVVDKNRSTNRGRVVGTSTRVLRCCGSAAEDAGTRTGYELPETLPLSWAAIREALGKDDTTLPAVKAKWHLFTPDQQRKAMAWLKVVKLEDAPVAKLRHLLNTLKSIEMKAPPEGAPAKDPQPADPQEKETHSGK
jgi:hypothetical protein